MENFGEPVMLVRSPMTRNVEAAEVLKSGLSQGENRKPEIGNRRGKRENESENRMPETGTRKREV